METTTQSSLTCPVCSCAERHEFEKGPFRIARCSTCASLFVENPPEQTRDLYDASYFVGGGDTAGYGCYDQEKEAMRDTFETCLDRIQQQRATGALFDVGAATGYFLGLAKERGYAVSGIDISAAAAALAKAKGLRVLAGTLDQLSPDAASHDVVTLFDVLEHVADPAALLGHAARLLKKDGILMGCTPNSGSRYAALMGKRWHALCPPEHLVWMTEASLRDLLSKDGFEVIWTGHITKRFSLPYIATILARWIGMPVFARLGERLRGTRLGRIALPLDVRDNVFFLAKRR
ncbi:hypothetical protein COU19_00490 [Candidatus Kaiserbacteria bacterium CG10_big_fil_rev_8_21_14_0_10_56_12]|uniref:Class I SAM-dependent methyltransferase n=1 Tax=Candidatus Kaiserbacteria bacterium CG10_big_fil_rev_8_21_14_0_10_56_12 TaxID=1974611 RepID=A0A2H0UCC3_9BACT|nr:MAG: hypothetical protein COU19_00490 [Candidatus Kaiserbacteria bacterium CG10_big_fil_rev_8_21_14_0_10_56_12]